jgi:hypothetical protein
MKGVTMITIEAVNSDLDKIVTENQTVSVKFIVAVVKVVMKFLSTMRSNQLLTEEDKKELKARKNEKKEK